MTITQEKKVGPAVRRPAATRRPLVNGSPRPSFAVRGLKGLVLLVAVAAVILPFVSVLSTSFADQKQISADGGFVFLPTHPNFAAYVALFQGGVVTRALVISLGITAVGTAISLTATAGLAYALSRPGMLLHRPLLLVVIGSLLFTPGIIPNYLVVQQLRLLNSYWSLILPVAVNAFNVIVMRAFFMNLPRELLEAARLEGAGELAVLRRVVLPLSKAVIAVIGLFYAVSYWNAFFNALLYLNNSSMWPLQLIVRSYVVQNATLGDSFGGATPPPTDAIEMAILVLSIVPVLVVYPFIQRHFAKGVLTGAIKG